MGEGERDRDGEGVDELDNGLEAAVGEGESSESSGPNLRFNFELHPSDNMDVQRAKVFSKTSLSAS